ncbi:tRNA (adenosine(37)-N6)-dimethylallyltransferase MiaA [soil metagenome]
MAPDAPPRHLALVGTTASGKSALALDVARCHRDIELVSVDSMGVYRGMDIGTAKPTAAEQAEVSHHLIDLAEPTEEFTLSRYRDAFDEALAGIEGRGHRALLVGGTALYLRTVVDNLAIPGRYPETRAELEERPETAELYAWLARLDPLAAGRMQPTNRRRVLRALEVTLGSGRPFSSYGPGPEAHPPTRFDLVGIPLPREVVAERIVARYRQQLEAGFLDEVRRLTELALPLSRPPAHALGFAELLGHLAGRTSLEEAVDLAVRRTRRFARRQRGWFHRDPRLTWFESTHDPADALPALLDRWSER